MRSDWFRPSSNLTSRASGTALALALLLVSLYRAPAQASQLSQSVLVVYNSANSDSINVADYYVAKRGIPAANLCAIAPPSTASLSWSAFVSKVSTPIGNCLEAVGWSNILYIVFAYQTPYSVIAPDGATYAIDQFIADIWNVYTPPGQYGIPPSPQPYYANAQSEGNVYIPFSSFAAYRMANPVPIFSVWRLDAATAALAEGLVDNALLAESAGLSGQVCIDEQFPTPTYDYGSSGSADWDLRQAATFAREAGFSVTQDFNEAEFGTSPAPLQCDNAALYSGLYSLNHYNNAFTWNPGAIGFHLDSASAYSPRSGPNWSANALIHGITVTSGTVSEPYTGLPQPDGVFRNLFEGANVGDAFMRNTIWLKWTIINMGDPLYRPFPAGFPAVTAPQNSLALNPQSLIGGNGSTGTITLAAPAPVGGLAVALKSGQTTVATVPPIVTVAAGQTTAAFPINTKAVTQNAPVYVSATFGASTITNTLVPEPLLASVVLSPTWVTGGTSAAGYVFLNAYAPQGGIVANVSSSNTAASVPATVPISQGTYSATFTVSTTAVSANTSVTISASYAGAKAIATLGIRPPAMASLVLNPTQVKGGGSTTGTITLTGPAPSGGATVTLSTSNTTAAPLQANTIVVPTNATTASFSITTNTVTTSTSVNITAASGGVSDIAKLIVTP